MMRTLILLAIVAAVCATDDRKKRYRQTKKKCKNLDDRAGVTCMTLADFQLECDTLTGSDCYVAKKVSEALYNGECCDEFKCELREDDPCCGVTCEADTLNAADQECNIIYPNNEVWNDISPKAGSKYAELVTRKDPLRGQCCDKYKCRTDYSALCTREVLLTPCVTEATCPACHTAEISEPADAVSGKCCPDIVCVKDEECMCNQRENTKINTCPQPTCDTNYEFMVILAEATADSCCPVYTCQRNLRSVCEAKLLAYTGTAWDGTAITSFVDGVAGTAAAICGSCQKVTKYRASNPDAGRCFPRWKCAPVEDKCCESDFFHGSAGGVYPNTGEQYLDGAGVRQYSTCADIRAEKANCDANLCEVETLLRSRNTKKGRCCDTYTCSIDSNCVCDPTNVNSRECPFEDADAYQAYACPNRVGTNVKQFYEVVTILANPGAGKCCDTYICRETAAKKLKDVRKAKRKAKKAAKKAAKASTTARR